MQASENNPLSPNLPTSLSINGIHQLFTSSNCHELILQIIKISEDYSENRTCHLSDGFCYVTCLLTGQARVKNLKGELEVFDVVKIRKQHIIVLGLERVPALELCDIITIGMRLLCAIGQPVAYMTYFHNNFVNNKGSSVIADGQKMQNTTTIAELTQNYPHVPSKWVLKARVVKMPENISVDKPFMIVKLLDQKQNVIEGVFFGQVAIDAHKKLSLNREYLFNNGQVKTKKQSASEFEIKFTQQSQIIPIQLMKNSNPQVHSSQSQLTINDVVRTAKQNSSKLVSLVGKVRRIKNLAKGRSIQITDRNSQYMEIVLWEEITDEVIQGSTYCFQNLRTKIYRDQVSLQSVRSKTTVKKVNQFEKQQPKNANGQQTNKNNSNQQGNYRPKQLRQFNNLLSVTDVVDLPVHQKQYKDIRGYLVIPTMYMDTKNFFKIDCPICPGMNLQVSVNPVMCKKCSSTKISIRWNIRCHIIDQKEDIKCYMNEQLCQKLLKMGSMEGFIKFNEQKQGVRKKMQEISHLEGIWRVKLHPSKDSVYYYIVDVYKNDSSALLKKAYKDFKLAFKKYITS